MENKKKMIIVGVAILLIFLIIFFIGFLKKPYKTAGVSLNNQDSEKKIDIKNFEEEQMNENKNVKNIFNKKTSDKYSYLLLDIIELRENYIQRKIIETAQKVSDIDEEINTMNNTKITNNWETITLCLAENCSEEDFIEFILTVILEKQEEISNGEIIEGLLTANKYWNTDNVVKFSKALTETNQNINLLNDATISETWFKIIDCNGICIEKEELIFEIIKLLSSKR